MFGDTHFHTELSVDAGTVGTRLDVDDAFRFAPGEKMISNTGQPVQDRAYTSPIWYTP